MDSSQELGKFTPERILVIQLRQIGDVLLTTPALAALRRRYPESHIAFLAEEKPGRVLWGNPDVDEVIVRPVKGFLEQLRLLERIRKARFELVVDYLANLRCLILSNYSFARASISYRSHRRWMAYNLPVRPEGIYAAQQKLSLLRVLGCPQDSLELKMALPQKAKELADKFWSEYGLDKAQPVVCIEPFHKRPVRQYPGEHFAKLADIINRNWGGTVIFTWGPGKKEEVQAILDKCEEQHLLAPETDLHELAAIYNRADLYVGNDCGPRHIAASQGTPTFVILGPTGEDWTPPDPRHRTVAKQISCRPCNLKHCPEGHHACMRDLQPEEVFAGLDKFWKEINVVRR